MRSSGFFECTRRRSKPPPGVSTITHPAIDSSRSNHVCHSPPPAPRGERGRRGATGARASPRFPDPPPGVDAHPKVRCAACQGGGGRARTVALDADLHVSARVLFGDGLDLPRRAARVTRRGTVRREGGAMLAREARGEVRGSCHAGRGATLRTGESVWAPTTLKPFPGENMLPIVKATMVEAARV